MCTQSLLSYLNILAEREPDKRLLGSDAGWLSADPPFAARRWSAYGPLLPAPVSG